ncbi:MAG: phenylalanine--tRNA ligase subunit alpha, partial [Bacteroidales bacterium]|nr:phenylalanine--tRNA ligase subunit alpha [Bacteroidales bacterium]
MLQQIINQILKDVEDFKAENKEQVEEFRLKFLSKKGELNKVFDEFRNVPNEQKKELGQKINALKQTVQAKFENLQNTLSESDDDTFTNVDLTLPNKPIQLGSHHPLSIVRNEIIDIFSRIGFTVEEGPEVEDDWHVFSALNFPPEHPARDMQDTFFIEKNPDILLRTHTSSVQSRVMEQTQPPIRSIFPGRVFRNEAISARAHCIFHQVEGLYVDTNVSFADLKQTLLYF